MSVGLVALLDDIVALAKLAAASIDDVGAAAGRASAKAAGVVIDDTAVTPRYTQGFSPQRELPIIKRIALGSLRSKLLFILPGALLLSQFASWLLTPLLMCGGAYLCFEGAEKILGSLTGHGAKDAQAEDAAAGTPEHEEKMVAGAIRTDFILSAEIIVITLGSVGDAPFSRQVATLSVVAVLMTVGVYGLVAGIVKLDDLGLALSSRSSAVARGIGRAIVRSAPWLMKGLGVAGTIAMFLVGGGILTHGFHGLEVWIAKLAEGTGPIGEALIPTLGDAIVGVLAGALLVALLTVARKVLPKRKPKPE